MAADREERTGNLRPAGDDALVSLAIARREGMARALRSASPVLTGAATAIDVEAVRARCPGVELAAGGVELGPGGWDGLLRSLNAASSGSATNQQSCWRSRNVSPHRGRAEAGSLMAATGSRDVPLTERSERRRQRLVDARCTDPGHEAGALEIDGEVTFHPGQAEHDPALVRAPCASHRACRSR